MARAPASKRLVVWVDSDYESHPMIDALALKGHRVIRVVDLDDIAPDLILSRYAWRWTPDMFDVKGLLAVAVKAARAQKGKT